MIIYNKHNHVQKHLTKVFICFCLLTRPVTSETLPVFPALCTQRTFNKHRYSVRQCVWRLGQETNLSEVPKVQRGDIAKLKDKGQVSCTWGNLKLLTEASQRLLVPWTCSQMLPRPQSEVHRMHISYKNGKSSRTPHNCDLYQVTFVVVKRWTSLEQWVSNFPKQQSFSFQWYALQMFSL